MRQKSLFVGCLLAAVSSLLVAVSVRAEGSIGIDVTDAALRLVPPAGVMESAAWETGTAYAQGAIVSASPGASFMCLVAGGGNSTNSPASGIQVLADGYRWVPVRSRPRSGLIIENLPGGDTVYVSASSGVSSTNGLGLTGGGAITFSPPVVPQGSFYVVSAAGTTNRVVYYEW